MCLIRSSLLHSTGTPTKVNNDSERRRPKKVDRGMISLALGVGETWLDSALKASRWLDLYGEGGRHASDEVITRLQSNEAGQVELFEWLKLYSNNVHAT